MFEGKKLFEKFSNVAKKAVDGAQQIAGGVYQKQADKEAQNNTTHTMYEVFTPAMGMGKKFVITENSLIYGGEEYDYSRITPICIVNPPAPLTNGTASTTLDGKAVSLAFDYSQKERFAQAMTYANEQIDSVNGTVRTYKYIIQSEQGSKLEVYEDYAIMYELKTGFTKIVSNSMRGGAEETVLAFSDIEVSLCQNEQGLLFNISSKTGTYSIQLNPNQEELAKNVIDYISKSKATAKEPAEEIDTEDWGEINGKDRQFVLCSETLQIPYSMDAFNTYRLKYYDLAAKCTELARVEYNKKVQNLTTYLEFFPVIYKNYLNVLVRQALDILVVEGIWTVTEESFLSQHLKDFHSAIDQYNVTIESIELTSQANQGKISSVMSFVPNLSGGGFGLKGAAKGIAKATAFNLVRDGAEASLLKGASQVNLAQQNELYQRINPDNLFEFVFVDYWRVMLSLISTLVNNGKEIWWPDENLTQQASNVFKNLSNPRFPQEQLISVFLQILSIHPYNIEYHRFMVRKFGDNEETQAIRNYFGYTDLNNSKMA